MKRGITHRLFATALSAALAADPAAASFSHVGSSPIPIDHRTLLFASQAIIPPFLLSVLHNVFPGDVRQREALFSRTLNGGNTRELTEQTKSGLVIERGKRIINADTAKDVAQKNLPRTGSFWTREAPTLHPEPGDDFNSLLQLEKKAYFEKWMVTALQNYWDKKSWYQKWTFRSFHPQHIPIHIYPTDSSLDALSFMHPGKNPGLGLSSTIFNGFFSALQQGASEAQIISILEFILRHELDHSWDSRDLSTREFDIEDEKNQIQKDYESIIDKKAPIFDAPTLKLLESIDEFRVLSFYVERLQSMARDTVLDRMMTMRLLARNVVTSNPRDRTLPLLEDAPVSFSVGDSYPLVDPHLQAEHAKWDESLQKELPKHHAAIQKQIVLGTLPVLGRPQDESRLETVNHMVEGLLARKPRHVVFVGDWESSGASFYLGALAKSIDVHGYLREQGLPDIHFVEGNDPAAIRNLRMTLLDDSAEIIVLSPSQDPAAQASAQALSSILAGHPRPIVVGEGDSATSVPAHLSGLLIAGLASGSHHEHIIQGIFDGAKKAHEEQIRLKPEELSSYAAYQFAQAQTRLAFAGQNVSVPLIFSTSFAPYTVWLARLLNRHVGTAKVAYHASGERATEAFHSTQQAWTQSRIFESDRETRELADRGFMSLSFINLSPGPEVFIGRLASHLYRAFSFNFLQRIHQKSLELSLALARRPIVQINFDTRTPEGLGQMIYFGQISAAMTGRLSGHNDKQDQTRALDEQVRKNVERDSVVPDLAGETLQVEQNILTINEEAGKISGVFGEKLNSHDGETRKAAKERKVLVAHVASLLATLTGKGLSGILKDYRTGQQLYHMDPEKVLEGIDLTQEMAAEFTEGTETVFAVQIGGSTSGEVMVDTLHLTGGPKIIGVHSYDTDQMQKMLDYIKAHRDSTKIVVISKSGLTTETDANASTLLEQLADAYGELPQLLDPNPDVHPYETMQRVLFNTDPQLGHPRTKARKEGWRTLDHPVWIGGRFSMFSNVGIFYYFMKGGSREDLVQAMNLDSLKNWENRMQAAADYFKKKRLVDGPHKDQKYSDRLEAIATSFKDTGDMSEEDIAFVLAQIQDVHSHVSGILGVWEGFLDNLLNTAPGYRRDTEVAVSISDSYSKHVSPQSPFDPQVRAESKSKPGVQYYATAVWGWGALRSSWNRLISNKRIYVRLVGEAPSNQDDAAVSRRERAASDAIKDELTRHDVPWMSVRSGPMSVGNLSQYMWLQYMRLAVDTKLYHPMKVSSEGQAGVEQTKAIARAYTLQIKNIIRTLLAEIQKDLAILLNSLWIATEDIPAAEAIDVVASGIVPTLLHRTEINEQDLYKIYVAVEEAVREAVAGRDAISKAALQELVQNVVSRMLRSGYMNLPKVEPHLIERMTETDMDLTEALGVDDPLLLQLVGSLLQGNGEAQGLATGATRKRVRNAVGPEMQTILADIAAQWARANGIGQLVTDGRAETFQDSGAWDARVTTLDSLSNTLSNVANGSRIGLYRHGEKKPAISIQIIWGSSVRVVISNGLQAQDYILLDDGRLVEMEKAAEDNRLRMAPHGDTLSLGAPRHERPKGVQDFEEQIQWPSVDTKTRHSNSGIDYYFMMNKQGVATGFLTWAEALEQAEIMESASGSVMVMTATGLRHIRDLDPSELPDDLLTSQEQVYVYAGNRDAVTRFQVFYDLLSAQNAAGDRLAALDMLDRLKKIDRSAALDLRAQALMLVLHLERGLSTLPSNKVLTGNISQRVIALRQSINEVKANLGESTLTELKTEYLDLTPGMRREQRKKFVLLGHPSAHLRSNHRVHGGPETVLVYDLEQEFTQANTWDLLETLSAHLSGDASVLGFEQALQRNYSENISRRQKPAEELLEIPSRGISFSDYLRRRMGIDPIQGMKAKDHQRMEEASQAVFAEIANVFVNDKELDPVDTKTAMGKKREAFLADLRRFEPQIFHKVGDREYMHSLRWMLDNVRERKSDSHVNPTGDVSSRLDNIFNRVLIYWTLPLVSVMISEEESDPILNTKANRDNAAFRLVLMQDPVDGSSQVKDGGAFGMFQTLAVLLPGQEIKDIDFQTQTLGGFDMQFGPQIGLGFWNARDRRTGEESIDKFQLFEAQGGYAELKQIGHIDSRPLAEQEDTLQWDQEGLMPLRGDRTLAFAMGGSPYTSKDEDGHRELIQGLLQRYGYDSCYTGFLGGDIWQMIDLMRKNPLKYFGMMHTYGRTNTDYPEGRFRVSFEEIYFAKLMKKLGGEVSNGRRPTLELHLPNERPSEMFAPFYATTRWISKFTLAWMNHVDRLPMSERVPASLKKEFEQFEAAYIHRSAQLIQRVVEYSETVSHPKTVAEVRRALLDLNGNISALIFADVPVVEIYEHLFVPPFSPPAYFHERRDPVSPLEHAA